MGLPTWICMRRKMTNTHPPAGGWIGGGGFKTGAAAAHSDEFGKAPLKGARAFEGGALAPLLVGVVTPAVHYTLGGVAIDEDARVRARAELEARANAHDVAAGRPRAFRRLRALGSAGTARRVPCSPAGQGGL